MTDRVIVVREAAPRVVVVRPAPKQIVVTAPGPRGATGPAGPGGGASGLPPHVQSSPSATWLITHNLGRVPAATVVVDSEVVHPDVLAPDLNRLTLVFATPQVGTVYI